MNIESEEHRTSEYQWSLQDQEDNVHKIGLNGSRIKFGGSRNTNSVIRTAEPIPHNFQSFYFEVKILECGQDGAIGIGLTPKNQANRPGGCLPGWNSHGIAYYGQYGRIYHNSDAAVDQTDTYTTGDIVGCYLSRMKIMDIEQTIVQFTKNGSVLGPIRCIESFQYYPTVGSASTGSVISIYGIEANFGQKKFESDILGK